MEVIIIMDTTGKSIFAILAIILLFSAAISMPKIEAAFAIAGILATIYLVLRKG